MKISMQAYGPENTINSYGGLEVRFAVNWAHWLREQGHQVDFFHQSLGCDNSYDLCFDAPVSEAYPCSKWKAKKHVHSYFSPDVSGLKFLDCYRANNATISHPTQFSYDAGLTMCPDFKRVFTPIPYPDHLRPTDMQNSFDRTEILWCNKGNFHPQYGEDHHYYTHGMHTLRALVRLNKKVDFKITFMLASIIVHRPEVAELIRQFKQVEVLNTTPWTNLVQRMAKCKINTHAGGLTSAIFESVFCETVPLVPNDFGFFGNESREVNFTPSAQVATEDEIYDTMERLWLDEQYYNEKNAIFTEAFEPHRRPDIHWQKFIEGI